jgi:ABC-2 type transport system ATP-binding protein
MIDIKNLVKQFGPFTAVDNISFSVAKGEVLGFLGPNGAGKSTTMKMLCGFLNPTSGSISVCGHDVEAEPLAARRAIGYLPEGAPTYADMTARGFLDFIADVRELSGKDRQWRLDKVIDQVNIKDVLDQPIDTLSKGYKRRVGLAQAILHDPPVLVLDEPSTALDFPASLSLIGALRELAAAGHTLVLVTHHPGEIPPEIGRAILLDRGRVVADGPKRRVLSEPVLSELFGLPLAVSWSGGWCGVKPR